MTAGRPGGEAYGEAACAAIIGKQVQSLAFEENMGNWVVTFTDGNRIAFSGLVVSRYLPDGRDMRDMEERRHG